MEGEILSGRFARREDAAFLRRTFRDHGNQLHVSSHSGAQDNRELEQPYAGDFPLRSESAAENYALVEAARLRRYRPLFLRSDLRFGRATRSGSVSIAARFQKGR